MIETTLDKVYVNRWKSGDKTVYTVLNMRPEGVNGKFLKLILQAGNILYHYGTTKILCR